MPFQSPHYRQTDRRKSDLDSGAYYIKLAIEIIQESGDVGLVSTNFR